MTRKLTAVTEQEGSMFVSLCIESDIASQGVTEEEALSNLNEAVRLFIEEASDEEIQSRLQEGAKVASLEVELAQTQSAAGTTGVWHPQASRVLRGKANRQSHSYAA